MSNASKRGLLQRASLLVGEAANTAGVFGKSLRYQFQSSLNVPLGRLAPGFTGALRFTQMQKAASTKTKSRKSKIANRESNTPNSQFPIPNSTAGGGFGGPLRVILSAIIIFLASQFIAAFIVSLANQLASPVTPASDSLDTALAQFGFIVIAEVLAVWMVWSIVKRRGIGLAAIGLGRRPKWNDLWWGIAGFGVFYTVVIVLALIISLLAPGLNLDQQQDVGFKQLAGTGDLVLAFISLVLLPPIAEEILVRGYLYSGLRRLLKLAPAILITSLLFGAAHLQTDAGGNLVWLIAADTFLLSLGLIYLRDRTNALYAGMAMHAFNNFVAYLIHFN